MAQLSGVIENILYTLSLNPEYILWGNSLVVYVKTLVLFAFFIVVFKIFQFLILKKLESLAKITKTDIDDILIEVVRSVRPTFYSFIAFYLAIQFLVLSDIVSKAVGIILVIWVFYQVIASVQILINKLIEKKMESGENATTRSALNLLGQLAKGALWAMGILMILSNLGVNVSSLIAGLGIGGIAIAFALQNILGDLFSSFALYFDKPFEVGDFILVGSDMGTVEKIGIKTTRLRALQGEELVISNRELTSARVQNYKKMEERRIVFAFGVTYQTPTEKLKEIPSTVKHIIESLAYTRFDRAHFKSFGDSALNFEVVYYIETSEYAKYMDAQQNINLKLAEAFEKDGIDFAYPTQTIYLEKNA
jgi:small-conductance mechanosensitive channel